MKLKNGLSAQALRVILLIVLIALLIGSGVGFYIAQKQLRSFAQTTNSLNQQADASDTNLKQLKQLQVYLATHKSDIAMAHDVVADQQTYLSTMIEQLKTIANRDGVTISEFSFSSTGSGSSSTTPSTPTNGSATTPTTGAGATSAAGGINGVKTELLNITLKTPLSYTSLLNFVNDVENNSTRMQISSLAITGGGGISISPLTIQAYVR